MTDDYPTIKDVLKGISKDNLRWYTIGGDYNSKPDIYKSQGGVAVKRTETAIIKVQPYKASHKWRVYNIYFDKVAIGICISDKVFL